ncbi:MAG: transglutaminase-like domain-containing protein [Chloroflexota bacterium]|nr:transglutaminase-like domain-containing protein [Chloroflexota bacterium]
MTDRAPYASQSPITDPGEMAGWLSGLPADFTALRALARPLVAHYRADDLAAFGIPAERVAEIDTRFAERMLARLHAMDSGPLTPERAPAKRLVGCCRDFTLLYLTMLRHAGIPARARVGFAGYFDPGWFVDHVVAEVWDEANQRWRLIDPQLADVRTDPNDDFAIDTLDIPRDRFLVGGTAWQACRRGELSPERFVVDPALDIPVTRGWLQLRHNLVQDLASLTKREMILWDTWGILGDNPVTDDLLPLLDGIAAVTANPDVTYADAVALYEREPGVQVPAEVASFNMLANEPRVVASGV